MVPAKWFTSSTLGLHGVCPYESEARIRGARDLGGLQGSRYGEYGANISYGWYDMSMHEGPEREEQVVKFFWILWWP